MSRREGRAHEGVGVGGFFLRVIIAAKAATTTTTTTTAKAIKVTLLLPPLLDVVVWIMLELDDEELLTCTEEVELELVDDAEAEELELTGVNASREAGFKVVLP